MNFDEKFYKNQARVKGLIGKNKIIELCNSEYIRISVILRHYLDAIKAEDDARALDVPCGYGNMLNLYRREGINAKGFDIDENQVNLAKSIDLNAHLKNVFDVDDEGEYSVISSFDFIEHLEKEFALDVLEKFYGLLHPNGYLFLRTPCADTPFGLRDFAEDPTHKWIGTSNNIASLLHIAGFKSVEVYEDWPLPRKFKALRNFISSAFRLLTKSFFWILGFGWPRCLSSSMIIVAKK